MNEEDAFMSEFVESSIAFLIKLLDVWPKEDDSDIETNLVYLTDLLSKGFDTIDLLNGVNGFGKVEQTLLEDANSVIVEFSDLNGYLHRAKIIKKAGNKLLLEHLKFQCPACFGMGINDDEQCVICGGNGWGVA